MVIAIVASLAGLVIAALNPVQRLQDANTTKTEVKADDIRKAIENYTISNSSLPSNILSKTTYGIYDICKFGQTDDCVNLDLLVTGGYISEIPTDTIGATNIISGYKIEYDPMKTSINSYTSNSLNNYVKNGATLTKGLVAYWKMDENSWNGTSGEVIDYTGNQNNGTAVSGTTIVNGLYNKSANLDGVDDSIEFGYKSHYLLNTNSAISMWLKPSLINPNIFIMNYAKGGYEGWQLTMGGFYYSDNASPNAVSCGGYSSFLNLNSWNHLLIQLDRDSLKFKIYVNSQLVSTCTILDEKISINSNFGIGRRIGVPSQPDDEYNGLIDDVRFYNRILSTEEISALYNYAPPAIAQWKFDENSGLISTS